MKVFYSMLTACAWGAFIALFLLFSINFIKKGNAYRTAEPALAEYSGEIDMDSILLEEPDADPSFISRFSRVVIYSADNGKEVIESAKSALSRDSNIDISAKAYAVIDLERDAILLEKNVDKLLPIASITKLATAVVSKKLLNQNESISIGKKVLSAYGNEARFREGEKMKVGELLYPLLMVSSNDASEAIALSYDYGRANFIKEMNSWANSIGAYRTYFYDPSGLSSKNVSTPQDLAIIVKWILKNEPEIFDITLSKSKTIRTHTWINPTHFLNLTSYAGGKNGYTPEANRTSVALFKLGKQQRLYAVILLGSTARDNDILDLLEEALR